MSAEEFTRSQPLIEKDETGKKRLANLPALLCFILQCKGPLACKLQARDASLRSYIELGHHGVMEQCFNKFVAANSDPTIEQLRREMGIQNKLSILPALQQHLRTLAQPTSEELQLFYSADHPIIKAMNALASDNTQLRQDVAKYHKDLRTLTQPTSEELQLFYSADHPIIKAMNALASDNTQLRNEVAECHKIQMKFRTELVELTRCTQSQRNEITFLSTMIHAFMEWVKMSLRKTVQEVIEASIMNPTGKLIEALRNATKRPSKKSTTDQARFPEDQRATADQINFYSFSLAVYAKEKVQNLSYPAWKKIRSPFGVAVKKAKLYVHLHPESATVRVDKPLLWSYWGANVQGGGVRYVHLKAIMPIVDEVFFNLKAQEDGAVRRRGESFYQAALRLSSPDSGLLPEAWPEHEAEFEPMWPTTEEHVERECL